MKKILTCLITFIMIISGTSHGSSAPVDATQSVYELPVIKSEVVIPIADEVAYDRAMKADLTTMETVILQSEQCELRTDILPEEEPDPTPEPEPLATSEEIELLALCTMAEAEGECEEGQRLVIDSVLNRVDDPHFPDTISEVIWQKNQYVGMYGERIARCYVMDELVKLVEEELENRSDYDVVFFNAGHYSIYGAPMFQVGNHYFSSYD